MGLIFKQYNMPAWTVESGECVFFENPNSKLFGEFNVFEVGDQKEWQVLTEEDFTTFEHRTGP